MERRADNVAASELLEAIDDALDALVGAPLDAADDRELLDLLHHGVRLGSRLHAWRAQLAARLERDQVAWRQHGTSTSTWLADAANLTRAEAGRLLARGALLAAFPRVADAAGAGHVLPSQAEAIARVLVEVPDEIPPGEVERAQEVMLGFAQQHNAVELRRLTEHLLRVLAPERAEELEACRLERQHRLAVRNRQLTFSDDHAGSVFIRGRLPVEAAEPLRRLVDAYAPAVNRGADALDPEAEYVTPAMRRADGLVALVAAHQRYGAAPGHGGDRPRAVVTMTLAQLEALGTEAGVVSGGVLAGSGQKVCASVLRRLLCDCDVLPMVLGGPAGVLDVGRARRLVTPDLRAALEVRDEGCVFPGCDKPPSRCQAHHLVPWYRGGATSLENLVLVCDHHHGVVEPSRRPGDDRWVAEIRPDGVPQVIPPRRVPDQRPRVHARFLTRRRR